MITGEAPSPPTFTYKEAYEYIGGLSNPSKMPGFGYSIPAKYCILGSILRNKPGTTCSSCYALKGRYVFHNVQQALERRFHTLRKPHWVDAFVTVLSYKDTRHFRWHDSGDLQGVWHLDNIIQVCRRVPDVKFWLPTREIKMVTDWLSQGKKVPKNLVIRISDHLIDQPLRGIDSRVKHHTSGVNTDKKKVTCRAFETDGQCGKCRKCWDPRVRHVTYLKH